MTKQEIMNNYAIEQGHENWRDLTISYGLDGKITTTEYIDHIKIVTDLIQEELKNKIKQEVWINCEECIELCKHEYSAIEESILNTEIL